MLLPLLSREGCAETVRICVYYLEREGRPIRSVTCNILRSTVPALYPEACGLPAKSVGLEYIPQVELAVESGQEETFPRNPRRYGEQGEGG